MNTVAAGAGSRLTFRNGLFLVGPEIERAEPGLACYRFVNPDCHVVVILTVFSRKGGPWQQQTNLPGRLISDYFPKNIWEEGKGAFDKQVGVA